MADIFDTLNNHDRRLRQLETKAPRSTGATNGLPVGGNADDMLIKKSTADYDVEWVEGIPAGGNQGDMLIKATSTAYDMQWVEGIPTGGTTGQVLSKASDTSYDMAWIDASTSTSTSATPAYVASSSASSATGSTSLTINMPTGVAEGDLVVIFVASELTTTAQTLSGWTLFHSDAGGTSGVYSRIFYKFMGATPDTSATITITSTNASAAVAYAIRNVVTPVGLPHPMKVHLFASNSTTGMPNPPSINISYDNDLILILGALDDDPAGTVGTVTVPANFTNLLSVDGGNATAGSNVTVMGATRATASKGAVDPAAFGGSGSDGWIAHTLTFWNTSSAVKKEIIVAASDETTALTTGTAKVTFRAPEDMYLSAIHLPRTSVTTAPVGANLNVDIDDDGVSIFSTVISIDDGEGTSTTAATPCVLTSSFIADDSKVTIDIAQVGSTTAGAGLKVTIYYYML